jgi:hypothetical protein
MMRKKIPLIFLLILLFLSSFLLNCSKKSDPTKEQNTRVDSTIKTDSTVKPGTIKDSVKSIKLTYEEEQGKFLYNKYCVVCHGEMGKGNGFNSYNLNPRPKNFADSVFASGLSDEKLFLAISQGGRGVGKSQLMPAYSNTLKNNEIEYISKYVLFLSKQKH